MQNTKTKFLELVSKMETLKDTEKGQLKGGFTSLASVSEQEEGFNLFCPKELNISCPKKPKEPEVPTDK